jgi:hypothetical protein
LLWGKDNIADFIRNEHIWYLCNNQENSIFMLRDDGKQKLVKFDSSLGKIMRMELIGDNLFYVKNKLNGSAILSKART